MHTDSSQSFSISSMEGLIRKLENLADPEARTTAAELIRTVLDLHRRALGQIVKELNHIQFGPEFLDKIARDPLVSNVLLLHGLHPVRIQARVSAGLERIEPYWKSAGYDLKMVEVGGANLQIQFQKLRGGGESTPALRSLIENAILNAAPEVENLMIEGLEENQASRRGGFIPLSKLLNDLASSSRAKCSSGKQSWQ